MKKYLLILTVILLFLPAQHFAQAAKNAEDEQAIRAVVENLYDAWKAGDGTKWADQFADDVDFTVWNGIQFTGREDNIKGHQMIFDTFYKGTEVRTEIIKIRFLTNDVAAVQMRAEVYKAGKPLENTPPALPLMILKKEKGKWLIHVFQNTPVIKQGDLLVINKEKSDKNEKGGKDEIQ